MLDNLFHNLIVCVKKVIENFSVVIAPSFKNEDEQPVSDVKHEFRIVMKVYIIL